MYIGELWLSEPYGCQSFMDLSYMVFELYICLSYMDICELGCIK